MMNYGPSPMQELDQEMQATPVHHTGPGGPRERQMRGVQQLEQMKSRIQPGMPKAASTMSSIDSQLSKLRGIITDSDIVHMLIAKGWDKASIAQLGFQVDNIMSDALGKPGSMESVQDAAADRELSFTPEEMGTLQKDIQNQNPGTTKTGAFK